MKCRLLPLFLKLTAAIFVCGFLLVLLLKWMPVYVTPLMLKRSVSNMSDDSFKTQKQWVSLDQISANMVMAVIASEDNRFNEHNGFDMDEIKRMRDAHLSKGKKIRGCSTISQQTAKNCFTWCTSTWIRKAFEALWTISIEKIWGKRRIMEVYLNIVEFGPGIYGVQAASMHYFRIPASKLSASQAASLAYCLPAPLKRSPIKQTPYMLKRRHEILSLMSKVPRPSFLDSNFI